MRKPKGGLKDGAKERLTCISVRLNDTEYKAIQALAKQEFTTMSGILRRLLRDAVKGREA